MRAHAIVNIGDSLRFLSGLRLKSALHRVVPVAEMEYQHRFWIAYSIRPVHGTVFKDSEGGDIKAEDWFNRKLDVMRKSRREQRMDTVLTGGLRTRSQGRGFMSLKSSIFKRFGQIFLSFKFLLLTFSKAEKWRRKFVSSSNTIITVLPVPHLS